MAPHQQYLSTAIGKFVDEYVMPSLPSHLISAPQKTTQDSDASRHDIYNYACSFMVDLLLVEEFNDAVHEGDGKMNAYYMEATSAIFQNYWAYQLRSREC